MKILITLFFIFLSLSSLATEEKTIHVQGPWDSSRSWMQYTSSEQINLKKLFDLLSRSQTGQKLLSEAQYKAAQSGFQLESIVKVGEGSLTDTTLVRKFSPHSPEHVIYESRSVVYINRNLSWDDALLDLAHELTHYVYREGFNPYSESFNAGDFIRSTIEGGGGEAHAFLTECHVLKELFSKKVQTRSNCQKIEDSKGHLSFDHAVNLFYQVGSYYGSFKDQLNKRQIPFDELNSDKINFVSSAYGVPYPVAALMEYDLIVAKVCDNDKKRLVYMQQGPKRGPASADERQSKFFQSYTARCGQLR